MAASTTVFPKHNEGDSRDLWRHAEVPAALANTPQFFQHLLSTPPTEEACQAIAAELQDDHLVICSDGACDPSTSQSSHGVVFASDLLKQRLTTLSGPVDGHPFMVTSYRAELSGIIAVLYIIHCICQFYHLNSGTLILYCDNKGALKL